jgi:hypothetical protein
MSEIYYIYDYQYDNVEIAKRYSDTDLIRRYDDNSFLKLTKIKIDHLNPYFETTDADLALATFEMLLEHYLQDDFISVSDFNDKLLWKLYDDNLKIHKEAIAKVELFYFIDSLQNKEFEYESYQRHFSRSDKQNKYIYFLKKNDIIVYVGQTKAIEANKTTRPNQHTDKDFDSFEMIQLNDTDDINVAEAFFIMKHKPFYNKALSVSSDICMLFKYIFKSDWDPYKNRK